MLVAQSPISGHQRRRKPLQPKNSFPFDTKPKSPNVNFAAEFWGEENNKENILVASKTTPVKKECPFEIDASLAEELSAIRQKLERLRIDKEKTDLMLRERSLLLDLQMKEMVDRGMLQKHLEIEVDRLFRLKEIKLSCTSVLSPLRSLRDKEQAKKMQDQLKAKSDCDEGKELKEEALDLEIKTEKEN